MADSYIEILDANDAPKKVLTDLTGDVHTQQARLIAANEATLAAIQAAVEALQTAVEAFTSANRVQADVLGTVTADTGLSQPLTDTELRATAVPVSGTVSVDSLPAVTGTVSVDAIGTDQTNPMKQAFTAHRTGERLVAVMGEKAASLPDWSGEADGDFLPLLQDENGRLWVRIDSLPAAPANDGVDIGDVTVNGLPVDGDGANATVKLVAWNPVAEVFDFVMVDNGGLTINPGSPVTVQGTIGSYNTTDLLTDSSGNAFYPVFVSISASSSGDNTIVAAVADKKIRVLSLSLSASAAVNAKFQSGASGTDLTGLYYLAANGGVVLPHNPHGWFETAASTLLNLNLSAANAVGGCLTYIEV